MSVEALREWEQRYRAPDAKDATEREPRTLLTEIARRLKPGRALDLACGTGSDALWLASEGWSVTAVDGSSAAIEILRRRAGERGLAIETKIADLERGEFAIEPGRWDLILISHYLQRNLFEPAQRGLAPGGVLIAIALLAEPEKHRYRVEPGELRDYFRGWEILHDREDGSGGHRVAEIAAQRRYT